MDRRLLLLAAAMGPQFILQLEHAGISSIAEMRVLGVRGVVKRVAQAAGVPNCANRTQALARAIHSERLARGAACDPHRDSQDWSTRA
ncbi:MAG: hypothetical protein KGJ30_05950 [Burkholderiales bacterium]|nr:hypothetical protein [Burkholderiales bacterium]